MMPDDAQPVVETDDNAAEEQVLLDPAEPQVVQIDGDALWKLLERLVPDEGHNTLTDENGKEHTVPTRIAARKQIQVFREMRALMTDDIDEEQKQAVLDAFTGGGDILAGLSGVLDIIADEKVVQRLDRAFGYAFPELVKELDAAPTEVFGLEEIVEGLMPFFLKIVQKPMRAMQALGEA